MLLVIELVLQKKSTIWFWLFFNQFGGSISKNYNILNTLALIIHMYINLLKS